MDCGLVARRVGCQAASGWPFVAQRLLPFPKPCHGQRGPVTWNRDCLAALGAFGTSAPSNGKGSTGGSSSGKQRRRSGRRTGSKGLTGLDETPHLAASDGELDVAHDDREDAGSAVPSLPSAAAPALDPAAPSPPHVSVMLHEVLAAFQPVQLRTYLDCTLGAGGHAAALAAAHPEMTTLLGIDVDPTAHGLAGPHVAAAVGAREGFQLRQLRGNYSDLRVLLSSVSSPPPRPDGILMDLGCSSMQFDTAERGFSFQRDGPLDMRMDPTAAMSAELLLNTASEAELGRILRDYGEEKLWRVVARRLVQAREQAPISTTLQLARAVGHTQIGGKGKGKGKGVHPATRTFQALRIAVNDELRRLEQALPDAIAALPPGGRLAVISFHSLEDRLVKHAFLRAAGRPTPEQEELTHGPGKFAFLEELEASRVAELVTRKPLLPGEQETAANPRARSAKLRVLQKL